MGLHIKKIKVKNFRSLKDAELNLGYVTVIYGPTSSGKSSLLYAPLIMKKFIVAPQTYKDALFDLGFINLGGYDNCVFNHRSKNKMELSVSTVEGFDYSVLLSENELGVILNNPKTFKEPLTIKMAYPFNINQPKGFSWEGFVPFLWNGITAWLNKHNVRNQNIINKTNSLLKAINSIGELIKGIDSIPINRGFFAPQYSVSNISPFPYKEQEVASMLATDTFLPMQVNLYLDRIINYSFQIKSYPGTSSFSLIVADKNSTLPVFLVNAGYGINQIVYILTKSLATQNDVILIEEPEIHLHPTIINNLAETLMEISKKENKQFIVVTHSETFVSSILSMIATEKIGKEEVKLFFVNKKDRETIVEEQEVNDKGQVKGGLSSFIEAELENMKKMLGL